MVRRRAILQSGGYSTDQAFRFAQDYELLSRLAMNHGVANLDMPLVSWRRHSATAGTQNSEQQQRANECISLRNLTALANSNGLQSDKQYQYSGAKAFLFTPAGQFPNLPAAQIVSGTELLHTVHETFYRCHDFSRSTVARHRRPLNWKWGKHAVALAVRAPWDLQSRIRILRLGVRSLVRGAWAVLS